MCYKSYFNGYIGNFDYETMTYVNQPLDVDGFKVKLKDEIGGKYFGKIEMYTFFFVSNWGTLNDQISFNIFSMTTIVYIDTTVLGEKITQPFL